MVTRFSKHHGLGNDFVVALVPELPAGAADLARRLCDRRTGIGADGLVFGLIGDQPAAGSGRQTVGMRLFNCDGGEAEISGNGLRCLVQAVARMRGETSMELDVATLAGARRCVLHGPADQTGTAHAVTGTADAATGTADAANHRAPSTVIVSVEMGELGPGPTGDIDDPVAAAMPATSAVTRWAAASIGNPHVVCEVDDPGAVDLQTAGSAVEAHFGGGINVHFAAVSGPGEITARVWERGVGVTSACGSGAVVMAACFRDWGLVGDEVTVRMPGGDARVDLRGPITLTGPATHVADIELSDA